MDVALSRAEPCVPIFEVEVIDGEGCAWVFKSLHLHEAIKISAALLKARHSRAKEPRISIQPTLLNVRLTDDRR